MNISEQIERLVKLHDDGVLTDLEFKEQISILPNGHAAMPVRTRPSARRNRIMLWSLGILGPMSGAVIGAFSATTATDFVAAIMAMAIIIWGGALAVWLPVRIARWLWPKLREAWDSTAVPSSRTIASPPSETDDHRVGVQKWIKANAAEIRKARVRETTVPPSSIATKPPPAALRAPAKRTVSRPANDVGPALQSGQPGSRLKFEYVNANGEITVRSLTNWIEYTDHIRGYCSKRGEVRTFRKDRVLDWIDGEHLLLI